VSRRIAVPIWDTPAEPTSWLINLILLVLLCVVVMAIATAGLRTWRQNHVETATTVDGAEVSDPVLAVSPERAAARSLFAASEEIERQARLKAQHEADERRETLQRQRLAEEEATRRALALEARREREWQAFYKKPASCDNSLPEVDSVGCANDFIRQRRTFDEQFAARNRAGV
jgi:hypothetical protein